eukprot:758085-Hanusia_phi.AAC.3
MGLHCRRQVCRPHCSQADQSGNRLSNGGVRKGEFFREGRGGGRGGGRKVEEAAKGGGDCVSYRLADAALLGSRLLSLLRISARRHGSWCVTAVVLSLLPPLSPFPQISPPLPSLTSFSPAGVVTVIWVENKVWVDTYGSRFVPPPAPIKVESKNICRHWQRGYCKDAAICPFTHDEICKHWQKCGHCPRGSKCAFLHQRH